MPFICSHCGHQADQQLMQCPGCSWWRTFEPVRVNGTPGNNKAQKAEVSAITVGSSAEPDRLRLDGGDIDRVLGGGAVYGFTHLLGAPPGTGKSTLLTQFCQMAAVNGGASLYVSGEESLERLRRRADRLNAKHEDFLCTAETEVDAICTAIAEAQPGLVVIDSLQSIYCAAVSGSAGGPTQMREVAQRLYNATHRHGCATFIVSHVNNEGEIAGQTGLQNLVDAILYLRRADDSNYCYLKATKHREAATLEEIVLEMTDRGLLPVEDISSIFLRGRAEPVEGAIVTMVLIGSRLTPIEIQVLASEAIGDKGKRIAVGLDRSRLELILAIMSRHAPSIHRLHGKDIFLSTLGDHVVDNKGADLAVALAIAGSVMGLPTSHLCVMGELSLTGEIVQRGDVSKWMREAKQRGFVPIMPETGTPVEEVLKKALR